MLSFVHLPFRGGWAVFLSATSTLLFCKALGGTRYAQLCFPVSGNWPFQPYSFIIPLFSFLSSGLFRFFVFFKIQSGTRYALLCPPRYGVGPCSFRKHQSFFCIVCKTPSGTRYARLCFPLSGNWPFQSCLFYCIIFIGVCQGHS